jgi:hypothetical protein
MQSLKKGKKKSIDRLHYKQYNDIHYTRTINDEKWRILFPHDMTDAIFNHFYRHHCKTKVNLWFLPLAASQEDHKNTGRLPSYKPTKQTSQ